MLKSEKKKNKKFKWWFKNIGLVENHLNLFDINWDMQTSGIGRGLIRSVIEMSMY